MSDREWTSESSEVYRQLASVAVPRRVEQLASLLTLIPAPREGTFKVVELASGEGFLAQAILTAFPNATLLALDVEATMRGATAERLSRFGERASVDAFDMMRDNWYPLLEGADVVVSSLCVHHLDSTGKHALFRAVYDRLSPAGALLIADIVLHSRAEARELYAAAMDKAAQRQAEEASNPGLFDYFLSQHWNFYRYPDDFDKPSRLFEQLMWLNETGFETVDCFWLYAGHAIYGGYKSTPQPDSAPVITYEDALRVASEVLRSNE